MCAPIVQFVQNQVWTIFSAICAVHIVHQHARVPVCGVPQAYIWCTDQPLAFPKPGKITVVSFWQTFLTIFCLYVSLGLFAVLFSFPCLFVCLSLKLFLCPVAWLFWILACLTLNFLLCLSAKRISFSCPDNCLSEGRPWILLVTHCYLKIGFQTLLDHVQTMVLTTSLTLTLLVMSWQFHT